MKYREFKFRAWDSYHQEMIDWSQYKDELVSEDFINHGKGPLAVMQYTGLKDKNGKEIYEGDIVIAWSQGVKGIFEIKRRVDGLWILYPAWKDGQFWYLRPTEDGCESCEVIGNIWEDGDLLEVEE